MVQYTWVVKNTHVNHKMTELQNMKLIVVLWFQKNQNTLPLLFKSSNMPVFKKAKFWELVAEQAVTCSLRWWHSQGVIPYPVLLFQIWFRPVRLPDSQGKGQCPPYASKGLGVVCCSGSDGRKRKSLSLQGRSPNFRGHCYCCCRLLIEHCLWHISNLFYS